MSWYTVTSTKISLVALMYTDWLTTLQLHTQVIKHGATLYSTVCNRRSHFLVSGGNKLYSWCHDNLVSWCYANLPYKTYLFLHPEYNSLTKVLSWLTLWFPSPPCCWGQRIDDPCTYLWLSSCTRPHWTLKPSTNNLQSTRSYQ